MRHLFISNFKDQQMGKINSQLDDSARQPFFDESTLVILGPKRNSFSWLIVFVSSLAILCAVYLWKVDGIKHMPVFPSVSSDDGNAQIVAHYALSQNARIAIVGSSLAYSLLEPYFALLDTRNLALAGGSPLTGLRLISNLRHRPQIVIIETNILSRSTDEALIRRFQPSVPGLGRAQFLLTEVRPIRYAVGRFLYGDKSEANMKTEYAQRAKVLLARPPETYDLNKEVQSILSRWGRFSDETLVRDNLSKLFEIIGELERSGTKVFLLEMPYSPEISDARYVLETRRLVAEANAARADRLLKLDLPKEELRWSDAAHPDERSSIILIKALEKAIANVSE